MKRILLLMMLLNGLVAPVWAAGDDSSQLGQRIESVVQEAISASIGAESVADLEDPTALAEGSQVGPYGGKMDLDRDLGFGKTLIAVVAILLVFGSPIMLVAFVLYAGYRKRRIIRDVVSQYLANGQPVPKEVWRGLAGDQSPRRNLHNGMILLGLGLGIFLSFWLMGSMQAAYLALIPLFIGIAQLLIWTLERNQPSPQE